MEPARTITSDGWYYRKGVDLDICPSAFYSFRSFTYLNDFSNERVFEVLIQFYAVIHQYVLYNSITIADF